MSVLIEKRTGSDRRFTVGSPPASLRERRSDDRRQTVITDISFFEWATHLANFCRQVAGADSKQNETPGAEICLEEKRTK